MHFRPNYQITDAIVNYLTTIAAGRAIIEQSPLLPPWVAKLRRWALLHSTHSSTAIEGNTLNLNQVEALASGKRIAATEKDKQEVLNYLSALDTIPILAPKREFSISMLLQIHRIVTKKVLSSETESGAFRTKQVFIGKRVFDGTHVYEEVEFMPPPPREVPRLSSQLIAWLNKEKTWTIDPVLLAGIVHYELVRIHPFIDGNGRTARLLATLILFRSGFDHRRLFALDDYYDRDRKAYYNALKTVDKETRDLTKWLEYFCAGVLYSVNEVKEAVLRIGIKGRPSGKPQIVITPRQTQIVEFIVKNGQAANKDFQKLFGISAQAVHKELTKLLELKVIKTGGRGRSVHYTVVDD